MTIAGRFDGTAALCVLAFCNTLCIGAFGPLLPEMARTQALADWELGILAGSFGLARMIADVPCGALAGRRLGSTLVASPILILVGLLLLATAGPLPVLVLGRVLTGLGHTLTMVSGLTAILKDDGGPSASVRLNVFEFAGMLGVLGGLAAVGLLPSGWGWPVSLLVASVPLLVPIALTRAIYRFFPDGEGRPVPSAGEASAPTTAPMSGTVRLMFAIGAVMGLGWAAVSQFIVPLRGAREFGLDRGGVSTLLAIPQLVDLVALLPVGWLADRIGRQLVLGGVLVSLGLGIWGTGLGPFPLVVLGSALLGIGMAGWMLPLGVVREHIEPSTLAWRTGLYRVGVDATSFLGPLICGLLGETHTAIFVVLIGLGALAGGARLLWRGLA